MITWNAQHIQTPKNLSGAKIASINNYFLASEFFDLHTLIRKLISRYFVQIIFQRVQKQIPSWTAKIVNLQRRCAKFENRSFLALFLVQKQSEVSVQQVEN